MLLINCWFSFASLRENEYSILSESGFPGFEDLQDVIDKLLVFLCVFAALHLSLRETEYCLNQDFCHVHIPIPKLV
ncbi:MULTISPECIES: hypothetical protein [unclassified Dolichospermum]|uniref:hypothetical protein n=1 Tax=unclassified Dolichospermum TaxID=2622029 RepID=UPI001447B3B1|nr:MULTISPECIES: hypothetical protein [unclassified Dolichospermum]MTJ15476.1 hypothetical protein [Dolichospermum sp. UHCC 0299]MTJ37314.1 hypothetical protein [Dolichospermum sp. UHCC 0406]